jgi:hypothetical protein
MYVLDTPPLARQPTHSLTLALSLSLSLSRALCRSLSLTHTRTEERDCIGTHDIAS